MHMQTRCKGSDSYSDLQALMQVGGQAIKQESGSVQFRFSSDVAYREYRRIRREQREGIKHENAVRESHSNT